LLQGVVPVGTLCPFPLHLLIRFLDKFLRHFRSPLLPPRATASFSALVKPRVHPSVIPCYELPYFIL
jgi:hypothetical protein